MRILLTTDGVFPNVIGGMSRHTSFLARHLVDLGVQVTVAHPGPGPAFDDAIDELIVPMPRFRFPGHYVVESWLYSRRVFDATRVLIDEFDAIYAQGLSFWAGIRRKRPCVVLNPHGLEMFQTIGRHEVLRATPLRWAMRDQARRADLVISLGGHLTSLLEERCRVLPDRIRVVPNAIDLDHIDASVGSERTFAAAKLLCIARLVPNKGLSDLITAVNEVESVRLTIVGDGPLRRELEGLVHDPQRVRFLGQVGDDQLFREIEAATGFVLPTLGEGMPTVVLEAMAASLPVIATNVGALGELVDETNGFVVPPSSPQDLARAIAEWRDLPASRKQLLGARSRERVEKGFTWEDAASRTRAVLEECQAGSIRRSDRSGA